MMEELAAIFAIDHLNFSILGNHIRVLVRNRPDIRDSWSDEEVAQWWCRLFPQSCGKKDQSRELTPNDLKRLLADSGWITEHRRRALTQVRKQSSGRMTLAGH